MDNKNNTKFKLNTYIYQVLQRDLFFDSPIFLVTNKP